MIGVPVSAARLGSGEHSAAASAVLHLALTRSAAVRLAPVVSALPGSQLLVDPAGRLTEAADTRPPGVRYAPLSSPRAVSRAVSQALEVVRPAIVLVSGDGPAALAATLAAVLADVPVARLGAGLRSGDRGEVREINRIAIDELAARLYTDSELAAEQLRSEGIDETRIRSVGSTVPAAVRRWHKRALDSACWADLGLCRGDYALVSLNRRESFADPKRLTEALVRLTCRSSVVLSADASASAECVETLKAAGVILVGPLDYVQFLSLQCGAGAVLTDSAGVQEESSVLGVPCFTLAQSSERDVTLIHGTNVLIGDDPTAIDDVRIGPFDTGGEFLTEWEIDAGRLIADDLLSGSWEAK